MEAHGRALNGEGLLTRSRHCACQELAEAPELVAQGRIRPVVHPIFSLQEADGVLRGIERMDLAGQVCAVVF